MAHDGKRETMHEDTNMSEAGLPVRVAVWNDPLTSWLCAPVDPRGGVSVALVGTASEAGAALERGEVDAALLPSSIALGALDRFDILSEVALSSWETSSLAALPETAVTGAGPVQIDPGGRDELAALVARVVLRENYGRAVAGPEHEAVERTHFLDSGEQSDPSALLDLGQEWYELTSYPMVWGVLVSKRGAVTNRMLQSVRDWMLAREEAYGKEDGSAALRFRLDDLAVAGLTELCDYLYYYGMVDQIPVFSPVGFRVAHADGSDNRDGSGQSGRHG